MRDSNAAGTLRATERLRHPHDNKPRAAASPTRAALANGARTLGTVLAAGAGTLALGLTAVKLGGLYRRHQSKRATEARSREPRVIVPNQDPQRAGTIAWTPEEGRIMVCVPGKCYINNIAGSMAWANKHAESSVRTLTYKPRLRKETKDTKEAVRPVCAAMARVLAERAADLDPKRRANALSDENGKWLKNPATCEFYPSEGLLECTMVRENESDKHHIPFESLLASLMTDEQRKALDAVLDEGKHPEKATEHADGAFTTSIGTVWRPEKGKIMVCVPGKCTIIDSAEAVAWVKGFAGMSVRTLTYKPGMAVWEQQRDITEAVRPVCAAMARALAEARLDPQLDSTNLTAKALSDENGTWLETHATCKLRSDGHLECHLKRGNELDAQLIPFASILTTIDAARVSAAFGHGLWHKTRGLALPAHSVVMYTE
jgi:hypothetical protein